MLIISEVSDILRIGKNLMEVFYGNYLSEKNRRLSITRAISS